MTFSNRTTTPQHKKAFYKYNKNIVTLRLDSLIHKAVDYRPTHCINSISYSKRPCLYTSHAFKGSITLEAAIALPLFLLVSLTIIYIINVMYLQLSLQIALEETARNISKTAYISSEFYSLATEQQRDSLEENPSLIENIGASIISIPYIQNCFLDEDTKKILENSSVENGSNGLSFSLTSVDMSTNIVDIVVTYKVTIPFISGDLFSFNLSNRCYMQIYMGKDMEREQADTSFYVYFTSYGKVYHTNKYCMYLLNYTKAIRYRDFLLQDALNNCLLCSSHVTTEQLYKDNPIIYITSDEYTYHTTLDCQSFTKDVFRIKRTSLEEDELCEECLKGK